jgi:hypothetical protein
MIELHQAQTASAGSSGAAVARDAGASAGKSRFALMVARCVAGLLEALHESRRREAGRELKRYRHLMWETEYADAEAGMSPSDRLLLTILRRDAWR